MQEVDQIEVTDLDSGVSLTATLIREEESVVIELLTEEGRVGIALDKTHTNQLGSVLKSMGKRL